MAKPAQTIPFSPHSPERQFQASEILDAVARAVMQLPENQREVLLLASRLQRARAQLTETLAAFEPDEERTA